MQSLSDDTARFTQYRNWLISVLRLNTVNPAYFCACMGSIAGTFPEGKFKRLGALAVLDYLRKNHRECWTAALDKDFADDSLQDFLDGWDPTHLPSLDSMGLGFLLHGSGVTTSNLSSEFLTSFTTNPNPFSNELTLNFTLQRMTYVQLAIYDELGRLVLGEGRGSSLEAGEHNIQIDSRNFPIGTLYARISTGFGEVKTIKLIHGN